MNKQTFLICLVYICLSHTATLCSWLVGNRWATLNREHVKQMSLFLIVIHTGH